MESHKEHKKIVPNHLKVDCIDTSPVSLAMDNHYLYKKQNKRQTTGSKATTVRKQVTIMLTDQLRMHMHTYFFQNVCKLTDELFGIQLDRILRGTGEKQIFTHKSFTKQCLIFIYNAEYCLEPINM